MPSPNNGETQFCLLDPNSGIYGALVSPRRQHYHHSNVPLLLPRRAPVTAGYVLSIDIGGTKLASALVDTAGAVQHGSVARRSTGAASALELLNRLNDSISESLSTLPIDSALLGIGVGCAGPIDYGRGATLCANLPGLAGLDLRAHISQTVTNALADHKKLVGNKPHVVLGLDGICAALAEDWVGAAHDVENSMTVLVSTGVGGGIILEGRPLWGNSGNCGHIGQIQVAPREPGTRSLSATLDYLASGPATVARAVRSGWQGLTGFDLARDAAQKNPLALAAVRHSAILVGEAVASLCAVLDLQIVAIGGGFSSVTPDYVGLVGETVRECAFLPHVAAVNVSPSALGGYGPLIGAAALIHRLSGNLSIPI